MSSLNRVSLLGRAGGNPDTKKLVSGTPTARFSLATSERWLDAQGHRHDQTNWATVVAFGNLANLVSKYVKKGRQIYIEGRLQTRSYEDKDGVRRYIAEVILQRITLLGPKSENESGDDAQAELPLEKAEEEEVA